MVIKDLMGDPRKEDDNFRLLVRLSSISTVQLKLRIVQTPGNPDRISGKFVDLLHRARGYRPPFSNFARVKRC